MPRLLDKNLREPTKTRQPVRQMPDICHNKHEIFVIKIWQTNLYGKFAQNSKKICNIRPSGPEIVRGKKRTATYTASWPTFESATVNFHPASRRIFSGDRFDRLIRTESYVHTILSTRERCRYREELRIDAKLIDIRQETRFLYTCVSNSNPLSISVDLWGWETIDFRMWQ